MSETRIDHRKRTLQIKRTPVQQRSRQRRLEILQQTALLLERVGFDDLTTTLIARELGISVGSLYHYFPHKQAILHAMGERWLEEYNIALVTISELALESLSLREFAQQAVATILGVYKQQKGMLPLVQAMSAVPELRELDEQHDDTVISHMADIFARLQVANSRAERQRIARLWLEMTHALLLSIVEQEGPGARRSQADLVQLCSQLLESHQRV